MRETAKKLNIRKASAALLVFVLLVALLAPAVSAAVEHQILARGRLSLAVELAEQMIEFQGFGKFHSQRS